MEQSKTTGRAVDLRVMSGQMNEAFIDRPVPLLSWRLTGSAGSMQQAYRIVAASAPELLEEPDLWDSGRVESAACLYREWGGKPLSSRQGVYWRVMVWSSDTPCPWSETGYFETALLKHDDWRAEWIAFDGNNPAHSAPCPYFRREFRITKPVLKARLYVAARGLFEMHLNGDRVSGDCFVPGWTDFRKQIPYLVYDVSRHIQPGVNAIGAILGDGWYCGYLPGRRRNFYGNRPELLAQLEITGADGTCEVISSDGSWRVTTGPILFSDLYDGEMYDARLEMPGWNRPGFDDSAWHRAESTGRPESVLELVLKSCPPVRRISELKPVALLHPRHDVYIWDLGQNISGRVRVRVKGYPGRLYTIRFGEMLNDDGTLYTLNYRSALSTDYYTCRGDLENGEIWEPLFTFHGFRYVEIDSFLFAGAKLEDIEVTGIVMYSDLEETGEFECSDDLLNRLYSNICWGQRGNFFEIPTDCPQRDERLGWTGDAQIFVRTATMNMDVQAFFEKWLRDLRDAQREDGAAPSVAPNILDEFGLAAWADAMVICPWAIYQAYGNLRVLRENYPAMKRWLAYQERHSENLIRPEEGYADWLSPSAVETPKALLGTAFFAHTAELLGETAKLLGHGEDAAYYRELSLRIKDAFTREYIGPDGLLRAQTQTACALALQYGLIPPESRAAHAELLERLIREAGDKLTTGFIGTGLIMPALTGCGKTSVAYDLLFQRDYPSWLFPVLQGATTMWERWNSYTLETGFGDVNMNSFNHYAYGAVAEWMYRTLLGIRFELGGRIVFAAEPDSRLRFARGSVKTPYGVVGSSWSYTENQWRWEISAPPNTGICVHIPPGMEMRLDGRPIAAGPLELPNGTYILTN